MPKAQWVPVTIKRHRRPLVEELPDVEGITLDGCGYGAFKQYESWNVTHLATGVHVQFVHHKRDLPTVLRALDALNLPVAETIALREKYSRVIDQ